MTFDEQLAAAMVAKLAGSTLKEVDQYTIQQSSTGPATKIDPTSFLTAAKQHQQDRQAAMIAQINRQAEMMHPLPQQHLQPVAPPPLPVATQSQPQLATFTGNDPNQLTFDFIDEATAKKSLKQLDLIVDYLYSINNKLDLILNRDKNKQSNSK